MGAMTTIAVDDTPVIAKSAPGHQLPPATLAIFGAGGDLTKRLIMPALRNLVRAGHLPDDFSIIGIDHNDRTTDDWRRSLTEMIQAPSRAAGSQGIADDQAWSWLTHRMHYMRGDFTEPETFTQLGKLLADLGGQQNGAGNVLFYLAVADRFFGPVVEQLGHAGLTRQSKDAWRRVIIEKPFGHDLASAEALNAQILKVLSEDQIYRIDHFLGKETVQNILVLRFANGIFEPLWNRDHVDHIQITAAETVGVEGRGRFYEKTGALRDMVPNHLFQLLAMIAMEPPISFDADSVRAKKTELFHAIHPIVADNAVRGQYGAGTVLGRKVPDYRREPDVAPDSGTETYVALKLGISATITDDRITAVLGPDVSIWSLTAKNPNNDIMRHVEDLREFRRIIRKLFDDIKAAHGQDASIHLFPAIPVSCAVELARVRMPKADLPLLVYDQVRESGFVHRLTIDKALRKKGQAKSNWTES